MADDDLDLDPEEQRLLEALSRPGKAVVEPVEETPPGVGPRATVPEPQTEPDPLTPVFQPPPSG